MRILIIIGLMTTLISCDSNERLPIQQNIECSENITFNEVIVGELE